MAPARVSFEGLAPSLDGLTTVAPARLLLHLAAHRLAVTQSFDELLALGALGTITPHRYQVETARRVLRVLRGRAMLSDEVGLGKTIEALLVLREYQLRGLVRRALIVVPAPLVAQWVGELADKAGIEAHTFDEALETVDEFWASDGVLVVSLSTARSVRHAPLAQAQRWDMVVVDEAHHIKNRATLGWKLIDGLQSRFLLLLTATPIEKSLEEIYNLVTLLRPGQFKTVQAFRKEYVDSKNPTSPRNREQLRGLLSEVMIRNTRAQSGLRLPPRLVSTVAVDTTPSEQSLYGSVVTLLREHQTEASLRLAASTLLLEAGSSVAALRSTLEKMLLNPRHKAAVRKQLAELSERARAVQSPSKLRAMEAILAENPGKVLIFTRFRETLREVEARLGALGQMAVGFHGGLDARGKSAALAAFAGNARILVASDVGGEGQNLQFCSTLINYDLPWNPMLIEQRIGRLHRMGQTREVRVYNLCARGTAEERVLDVLDRRVHLFELVVGEMDMVLGNLEDDRDLEERVLDLYARSRDDGDLAHGFDAIAAELLAARGRYEHTRAFDEALFGQDYEA
ncbi:MAG: DEAD/DEAH box helicase [Myxococcaceae bacterium]|nr:MAG: DEAD/DEAH box helicase [Myxococcaceae bacterium]